MVVLANACDMRKIILIGTFSRSVLDFLSNGTNYMTKQFIALKLILLAVFIGVLTIRHSSAGASEFPVQTRSISEWVTGDGKSDDLAGVTKAFGACQGSNFTLVVDRPVFIHIGRDIARPIFVDNETYVRFDTNGLFIVDNYLIPAFVLANSTDIHFSGWRIKYVGDLLVEHYVDYLLNGTTVSGRGEPGGAFNDNTLTPWLKIHRGIRFSASVRTEVWHGPSNMSAIFYLIGPTTQMFIDDMSLCVPADASGSRFIPMGFSITPGYENNVDFPDVITDTNKEVVSHILVSSNLTFKNISFDGYYMGFQGTSHDTTYSNITAWRYGDVQDDAGNTVGGVGKWFAPPHLFYLNGFYFNGTPANPLGESNNNKNVVISNVRDLGPRIGKARDTNPTNTSGYACSLKIGGIDMRVSDYESLRQDGLMDVLSCNNMVLSNIVGVYDSAFINYIYPGIRFPSGDYYQYLTLRDVSLTDQAVHADGNLDHEPPITGARGTNNYNIVFNSVVVSMSGCPQLAKQPSFGGVSNQTYVIFNTNSVDNLRTNNLSPPQNLRVK